MDYFSAAHDEGSIHLTGIPAVHRGVDPGTRTAQRMIVSQLTLLHSMQKHMSQQTKMLSVQNQTLCNVRTAQELRQRRGGAHYGSDETFEDSPAGKKRRQRGLSELDGVLRRNSIIGTNSSNEFIASSARRDELLSSLTGMYSDTISLGSNATMQPEPSLAEDAAAPAAKRRRPGIVVPLPTELSPENFLKQRYPGIFRNFTASTYACTCGGGPFALQAQNMADCAMQHMMSPPCIQARSTKVVADNYWTRLKFVRSPGAAPPLPPPLDVSVVCQGYWKMPHWCEPDEWGDHLSLVEGRPGAAFIAEPHHRFMCRSNSGTKDIVTGTFRSRTCAMLAIDTDNNPLSNSTCVSCSGIAKDCEFVERLSNARTTAHPDIEDGGVRTKLMNRDTLLKKVAFQSIQLKQKTAQLRLLQHHTRRTIGRLRTRVDKLKRSAARGDVSALINDITILSETGTFDDKKVMLAFVCDIMRCARLQAQNGGKASHGMRYHPATLALFETVKMRSGPALNRVLTANIGGPSKRCVERHNSRRLHVNAVLPGIKGGEPNTVSAANFYRPLIKALDLSPGEQIPTELQEDETGCVDDLTWMPALDTIVGSCGLQSETHKCDHSCCIVIGNDEDSYSRIVEMVTRHQRANYVRVILIRPLHADLPPRIMLALGTCNRFDAKPHVQEQHDMTAAWFDTHLRPLGLMNQGRGSDGDERRMHLMRINLKQNRPRPPGTIAYGLDFPGFTFWADATNRCVDTAVPATTPLLPPEMVQPERRLVNQYRIANSFDMGTHEDASEFFTSISDTLFNSGGNPLLIRLSAVEMRLSTLPRRWLVEHNEARVLQGRDPDRDVAMADDEAVGIVEDDGVRPRPPRPKLVHPVPVPGSVEDDNGCIWNAPVSLDGELGEERSVRDVSALYDGRDRCIDVSTTYAPGAGNAAVVQLNVFGLDGMKPVTQRQHIAKTINLSDGRCLHLRAYVSHQGASFNSGHYIAGVLDNECSSATIYNDLHGAPSIVATSGAADNDGDMEDASLPVYVSLPSDKILGREYAVRIINAALGKRAVALHDIGSPHFELDPVKEDFFERQIFAGDDPDTNDQNLCAVHALHNCVGVGSDDDLSVEEFRYWSTQKFDGRENNFGTAELEKVLLESSDYDCYDLGADQDGGGPLLALFHALLDQPWLCGFIVHANGGIGHWNTYRRSGGRTAFKHIDSLSTDGSVPVSAEVTLQHLTSASSVRNAILVVTLKGYARRLTKVVARARRTAVMTKKPWDPAEMAPVIDFSPATPWTGKVFVEAIAASGIECRVVEQQDGDVDGVVHCTEGDGGAFILVEEGRHGSGVVAVLATNNRGEYYHPEEPSITILLSTVNDLLAAVHGWVVCLPRPPPAKRDHPLFNNVWRRTEFIPVLLFYSTPDVARPGLPLSSLSNDTATNNCFANAVLVASTAIGGGAAVGASLEEIVEALAPSIEPVDAVIVVPDRGAPMKQLVISNVDSQDPYHCFKLADAGAVSIRTLMMGRYLATMNHLQLVAERFSVDVHGLRQDDIDRTDRQNVAAVGRRVGLKAVRSLVNMQAVHTDKHGATQPPEQTQGTVALLIMIRRYALIFLSKQQTHLERVTSASYVVHLLRLMRLSVRLNKKLTVESNFYTRQTYEHLLLSCHQAVNCMRSFRDTAPSLIVALHLTGSDALEALWSMCGGFGAVASHIRNFTFAVFLHAAARSSSMQEMESGPEQLHQGGRAHEKMEFPVDLTEEPLKPGVNPPDLRGSAVPVDAVLGEGWLGGQAEARSTSILLGFFDAETMAKHKDLIAEPWNDEAKDMNTMRDEPRVDPWKTVEKTAEKTAGKAVDVEETKEREGGGKQKVGKEKDGRQIECTNEGNETKGEESGKAKETERKTTNETEEKTVDADCTVAGASQLACLLESVVESTALDSSISSTVAVPESDGKRVSKRSLLRALQMENNAQGGNLRELQMATSRLPRIKAVSHRSDLIFRSRRDEDNSGGTLCIGDDAAFVFAETFMSKGKAFQANTVYYGRISKMRNKPVGSRALMEYRRPVRLPPPDTLELTCVWYEVAPAQTAGKGKKKAGKKTNKTNVASTRSIRYVLGAADPYAYRATAYMGQVDVVYEPLDDTYNIAPFDASTFRAQAKRMEPTIQKKEEKAASKAKRAKSEYEQPGDRRAFNPNTRAHRMQQGTRTTSTAPKTRKKDTNDMNQGDKKSKKSKKGKKDE